MVTLNEGLRILTKIVMILLVVIMNPLYLIITFRIDALFEERVSVILNLMKQPTLIYLCSPCFLTLIFPFRKKRNLSVIHTGDEYLSVITSKCKDGEAA